MAFRGFGVIRLLCAAASGRLSAAVTGVRATLIFIPGRLALAENPAAASKE